VLFSRQAREESDSAADFCDPQIRMNSDCMRWLWSIHEDHLSHSNYDFKTLCIVCSSANLKLAAIPSKQIIKKDRIKVT